MAERLDKSGLSRLWQAIQIKISSMVKTYSLTKSGDNITLSDNSGTTDTVTLGIPENLGYFGTSSSSGYLPDKVVACSEFKLVKGAIITFVSTNGNFLNNKLTLNVNNTGAKDVYNDGSVTSPSNIINWSTNSLVSFMYSGSYYYYLGCPTYNKQTLDTVFKSKLNNIDYFTNDFDNTWENGLYVISDTSSSLVDGTLPSGINISDYDLAYFNSIGSESPYVTDPLFAQEMTLISLSSDHLSIDEIKKLIRVNDGTNLTDWVEIPNATGVLF